MEYPTRLLDKNILFLLYDYVIHDIYYVQLSITPSQMGVGN